MNPDTDSNITELAQFTNGQMQQLNTMGVDMFSNPNKIDLRKFQPPQSVNQNQSGYIEQPMSNYAGSQKADIPQGMPSLIPIPADLAEHVKEHLSNNPTRTRRPPPIPASLLPPPLPQQGTDNRPSIPQIPEQFDFDLFQYATLKDISCNMEKIILQLEKYMKELAEKKQVIDKALQSTTLGRGK